MSDLIDRQAAIDAILAVTGNSSVRELYEHVQEHGLSEMWSGGVSAAIDIIIAVPSAQPNLQPTCNQLATDLISRQAAIDACIRVREYRAYDEIEEIKALPSAQPEPLSDAYMKAVWTWLRDYQIKVAELKGRYTPYEVLSWVANDWLRKEHE